MNDVNRYLITSITEFIDCLKLIGEKEKSPIWYRGHSKAQHKLLPGILREPFIFHNHNGIPFIPKKGEIIALNHGGVNGFSTKRLLELFKEEYKKKENMIYFPEDDFEWLCLMQHYGVPTRLLDWSTNAFTALFFALRNAPLEKSSSKIKRPDIPDIITEQDFEGSVVYVISPQKINSESILTYSGKSFREIFHLSDHKKEISRAIFPEEFDAHFFYTPICVSSKKFDLRILAQQGVFMLFGTFIWHLEYIKEMKPYIHKIFIPMGVKAEMAKDLKRLGFNSKTIFPDSDPNATIAKNRLDVSVNKILKEEQDYVRNALS